MQKVGRVRRSRHPTIMCARIQKKSPGDRGNNQTRYVHVSEVKKGSANFASKVKFSNGVANQFGNNFNRLNASFILSSLTTKARSCWLSS
ncbi:hypothetical protein DFQ50_103153 [Pseudocitrobacter faecalis]|uniref:Uncharacterized protein n=1 Tax=Pseudocitrobacter faecalis TaxID=1398493 RepID=A0ABX9FYQ8_9ENTR|nr:hypothetical protein DFQ50_103153 [Pseudocitrobacter faecalis]